jgi:hypothetical protein
MDANNNILSTVPNNTFYDFFLSHRQDNGGHFARQLKLELEKYDSTLKIFLDVDDKNAIQKLKDNINRSLNIIVLLTYGLLERQWVCKELRWAIKANKNIILVWDKESYPKFWEDCAKYESYNKPEIKEALTRKAILWISEEAHRRVSIQEIINRKVVDNSRERIDIIESIIRDIKLKIDSQQTEIKELKNNIQHLKSNTGFELIRTKIVLDQMQHIQLNEVKKVVEQIIPFNVFPKNTKSIIISVYLIHGNHPQGHAYLTFECYQKGSDKLKSVASLTNYDFDNYFNSKYYEVMIPWNTNLENVIVFDIKETISTGTYENSGNQNWYDVNVVGYILG